MTYQALFALFAALWLVFSLAGFALAGNVPLQHAVFGAINQFIPGLIAYDGMSGAIPASTLLGTTGLAWSSVISIIGLLFTTVGFVGTLRTAIRIMFSLPGPTTNPVLLILKNLGYSLAFGVVVLLTAVISLISNTALGAVLSLLGLGAASVVEQLATTAVGALLLVVIDTLLLAAAYRLLSGIPIPRRRLLVGALLGGIGLAFLQTLGTKLLGGASSNPLMGAFATLVGVLLYFNFVCQTILLAASWIAVGMEEAGIDARRLNPEQRGVDDAERLEEARRLVAESNQRELEERMRAARGLERWRLTRQLDRERTAEEHRRAVVPTASEFKQAQQHTGDETPRSDEVEPTGADADGPVARAR
jgi:membrane protein